MVEGFPRDLEIVEGLLRYFIRVVNLDTHGDGVRNDDSYHDVAEEVAIDEILLAIRMSLCIPNTLAHGFTQSAGQH